MKNNKKKLYIIVIILLKTSISITPSQNISKNLNDIKNNSSGIGQSLESLGKDLFVELPESIGNYGGSIVKKGYDNTLKATKNLY